MNASHTILHKVVGKSKQKPLPTKKCQRKASQRRWGYGRFHRLKKYHGRRTVLIKVMEGWYGFSWLKIKQQNLQGNLVNWLETWSFFSGNWLVPRNRFSWVAFLLSLLNIWYWWCGGKCFRCEPGESQAYVLPWSEEIQSLMAFQCAAGQGWGLQPKFSWPIRLEID